MCTGGERRPPPGFFEGQVQDELPPTIPTDSGDSPLADASPLISLRSTAGPPAQNGAEERTAKDGKVLLANFAQLTLAVSRAHQMLGSHLTQLAKAHGLSASELLVLWLCSREPEGAAPESSASDKSRREQGWVQNDIALGLGFSPAQTSSVVDKLQQQGLLQSLRSMHDRRRQLCQTTLLGQQLLTQIACEWEVANPISLVSSIESQLTLALSHLRLESSPPGGIASSTPVEPTSTLRGAA